jgi:hypothetical protein
VPIAGGTRCSIGIFSYLNTMTFGINADFDGYPDVEVLSTGIRRGLDQLLKIAGADGATKQAAAKQAAEAPAEKAPAEETPAKKATPAKATAKATAPRTAAAKKTAAKRAPAKKTAAAGR